MAENVTIARPYAEAAALELASAGNALGPWSEALDRLAPSSPADPQMRDCITDPAPAAAAGWAFPRCCRDRTVCRTAELRPRPGGQRASAGASEIRDLFVALKNEHEGVRRRTSPLPSCVDDVTLKPGSLTGNPASRAKLNVTRQRRPRTDRWGQIAVGDEVIDASVRGKSPRTWRAALKN